MLTEQAVNELSFINLMNRENRNLHGGNLISNINKIIFDYVGYNHIDNYTPHHYAKNENQKDWYKHNELETDFANSLNLTDKSFIYSIRNLFTEIKGIGEQDKYIDFGFTENCFEAVIFDKCTMQSNIQLLNDSFEAPKSIYNYSKETKNLAFYYMNNFDKLSDNFEFRKKIELFYNTKYNDIDTSYMNDDFHKENYKYLMASSYLRRVYNDCKNDLNNIYIVINDKSKVNDNLLNNIIDSCKDKNLFFTFQLDNNQKPIFESSKVLLKNGYSNLFEDVIFSDKFYSMEYESADTLKQIKRIAR